MSISAREAWSSTEHANEYLDNVRGAIPLAPQQIEYMIRLCEAGERPARRVLDLGCGDGVLTQPFLENWPRCEAVLVDLSPQMLSTAQARLAGYSPRVSFVEADYGSPSWLCQVQGPFDTIYSGFSIHHQPNERKKAVYAELYELLEPGGLFLNLEHVAPGSPWGAAVFETLMVDALHEYAITTGSQDTRDVTAQRYARRVEEGGNILERAELQCEWLRLIGFVDVDIYFKLFELCLFGGRKPESA